MGRPLRSTSPVSDASGTRAPADRNCSDRSKCCGSPMADQGGAVDGGEPGQGPGQAVGVHRLVDGPGGWRGRRSRRLSRWPWCAGRRTSVDPDAFAEATRSTPPHPSRPGDPVGRRALRSAATPVVRTGRLHDHHQPVARQAPGQRGGLHSGETATRLAGHRPLHERSPQPAGRPAGPVDPPILLASGTAVRGSSPQRCGAERRGNHPASRRPAGSEPGGLECWY